jgi:hypothetical protein
MHPDVAEGAQVAGEILQVDAGSAVHLRRILPGEQVDAQVPTAGGRT